MEEVTVQSPTHQKLKQDDSVTDQSVNQSRTTESDSGGAAYQVKVQEKVEITWLFDTGAGVHVRPKYVWEQYAANNKSNIERSKRTRLWSHG